MPRRGENIYKRKDGRWEGRVKKSGTSAEGYKSIYGKTYKEIKQKMEEYKKNSPERNPGGLRMGEVSEKWLEEKKPTWKPTTYGVYSQAVHKYIIPLLGDTDIGGIDTKMLEKFCKRLARQEGASLSNNYQFYICGLILRILRHAKKMYSCEIQIPDLPVARNKKNQVVPPGDFSLAVLENYLMENSGEDTCLGVAIALYTGIRIGELCALTWEDIDLEEGVVHIRRNIQRIRKEACSQGEAKGEICGGKKTRVVTLAPKTMDSMRVVPIPPALHTLLQERGEGKKGAVIAGVKYDWIDTRTLQYRFKKILKECGVEYFNFHMLRHAFATRCVALGFDVKSLSEILGHSSIQVTMSLYVHPSMQQKKQMMDKFHSYMV